MSKVKRHLYRHYDSEGNLLYIGMSLHILARLYQHSTSSNWFENIARIEIQHYPDRASVLKAEKEAIKNEKPRYNYHNLDTQSEEDHWLRRSAKTFCFIPRPLVRKKIIARAKKEGKTVSTVINDILERHA